MDPGDNFFDHIVGDRPDIDTIKSLSRLYPMKPPEASQNNLPDAKEDMAIRFGVGASVDVTVDHEMVDGDAHARAKFRLPFKYFKSIVLAILERFRKEKPA